MTHYDWSQYTYGGHSACTAIATFCAASFADGFDPPVMETRLQTLTKAGCALWADHHHRSQSVQEVVDSEPFFTNYKLCSWQCGPREGQLPLAKLLSSEEFGAHGNWGAVVTGGGTSVAIGCNGATHYMFDSHGPRATWREAAEQTWGAVHHDGTVDVTQFRR